MTLMYAAMAMLLLLTSLSDDNPYILYRVTDHQAFPCILSSKQGLGRALDLHANGAWLSKLTE